MAFDDSASGDLFAPASGGGQGPLDVRKLLGTLRRYYWVFIPCLLLAVAGALAYMKTVKPVYRASATFKVERRSATAVANSDAVALEGATTTEDLRTIERSFFSPGLMKRVVDKLNLRKRDNFVGANRPAAGVTEDELAAYLFEHCKVELVPDTRLIQVSFDSWNPQLAQEVANTIVQEGVIYDREQRVESLGGNVKYLENERVRLEENLKQSEEKLNEYTRQTGSVSIDDELNIVATQLRDLNNRHTIAKAERLKLESDYEQIQAVREDPDKLLDIESIRKVPAVERLYARAGELRSQLVKLAQKYRPANPVIIQTEMEIKEVDASLKQEIMQAPNSIEVALAAARRNEESLAREEAAQEKKVIDTKELAVRSQVLQRQIEADRIAYEITLKRLNEELAQMRSEPVLLQPVDLAGPGIQISVRKSKVIAGGVIIGLLLGAGILFLITQFDTSTKTVADAEGAFKVSVLAAVPVYEPGADKDKKAGKKTVLSDLAHAPVIRDPHSTAAEAFRSLRAAVEQGEDAAHHKGLILVTSAVPGEGKSFCALNLAIALAQSGQRTLLVDAQLRSPVLEERVFAARGGNGLADYLQGSAQFPSVIRATDVTNLDLVTAGSHARHPAEVLSRPRFPEFLNAARTHYDRVVFDTASVTSVSDTLSFVRFFPLVCVVLRAGATARGPVERALELLQRAGAKPHGLVLNFSRDKFSFSYAGAGGEQDFDFPKACPSCGHVFLDFDDYLACTRPSAAEPGAPAPLSRLCRQCGTVIVVAEDNRRDDTQDGRRRRNLFGQLHEQLVLGGMPDDEARAKLLLTVKMGRHETFNGDGGTTEAGRRRHHLFDELLEALTRAGLSREDARASLFKAIQDWRGVS